MSGKEKGVISNTAVNFSPDADKAKALSDQIKQMIEDTAGDQENRDAKVLEVVSKAEPDADTLAAVILSIPWSRRNDFTFAHAVHMKNMLKVVLDAMLTKEQVAAQARLSTYATRLAYAAVFFSVIQAMMAIVAYVYPHK